MRAKECERAWTLRIWEEPNRLKMWVKNLRRRQYFNFVIKFENCYPSRSYGVNNQSFLQLGFFDFDNRTYYLCDKPFCNWNGSIAIASLNVTWKPKNDTNLVPFEQNAAPSYPIIVAIFLYVMILNLYFWKEYIPVYPLMFMLVLLFSAIFGLMFLLNFWWK